MYDRGGISGTIIWKTFQPGGGIAWRCRLWQILVQITAEQNHENAVALRRAGCYTEGQNRTSQTGRRRRR